MIFCGHSERASSIYISKMRFPAEQFVILGHLHFEISHKISTKRNTKKYKDFPFLNRIRSRKVKTFRLGGLYG